MKKKIISIGIAAGALLALAGCSSYGNQSLQSDSNYTNKQLKIFEANQPAPLSNFSEYRQTLIDVESAQIHGVATTTFFFNQGVPDPVQVCPSIGFPVASTSQLTNPNQIAYSSDPQGNGYSDGVVGQAESNGTYTGNSSGTYVECVSPSGVKYANYAEEFAHTVGGPAHWDLKTHSIVLDGVPTVTAGSGTKK